MQATPLSVPDGMVVDFLTGRFFRDTPEEYVRQNIEKALVRQYRYDPANAVPEFSIKVGVSRKRIDVVVFKPGESHIQENAWLLVETKSADTKPSNASEGVEQLKSYMAACVNSEYGLWTNGDDRFCFAKRTTKTGFRFDEIIDIPAIGQSEIDAQRPTLRDPTCLPPVTILCSPFGDATIRLQAPRAYKRIRLFRELLKIIFCKIEDERSSSLNFFVTPTS